MIGENQTNIQPSGWREELPRIELKFPLTVPSVLVEGTLRAHPACFRSHYAPRSVFTLYFAPYPMYLSSIPPARLPQILPNIARLRLRWYGHTTSNRLRLELKWRQGQVGFKQLVQVQLADGWPQRSWPDVIREMALQVDTRWRFWLEMQPFPALLARYQRRYFISRDGLCRLTLDSDVAFIPAVSGLQKDLQHPLIARELAVLEIKTPIETASSAESISSAFPWQVANFSKFSEGAARLRLQLPSGRDYVGNHLNS